ncbi:MAG: cardiolipin synthase [Defluviitaleaceae bacterium]|nr:cardiolipin synthase [Defluviitaleaceae bacterium]
MLFVTIVNYLLIAYVIFVQRRNTAATWAWIVAMAFLPIFGFILYLMGGQDIRKQRVFLQKYNDDSLMHRVYREMGLGADEGDTTHDNRITLFYDGKTKFDALLEDIAKAREYIYIQYYIFRGDEIGRRLVRKLAERAMDGLDVRLLVDGTGCYFTAKDTFKPLTNARGKLGLFLPPFLMRLNYRNHRKLAVIDGEIAYLGGSNIGKEYLGMSERFGFWRDSHMRLTGGAVNPLILRFIMDWNFSVKNKSDKLDVHPRLFKAPAVSDTVGGSSIQILSSGPDTTDPHVLHGFCTMIMNAKKSIYIQTPYFVPDDALFTCLRIAALRGVDVRIMYPGKPDHPFVYWASSSYMGELMCAGVRGYEYTEGFIHCKTVMVDSEICAIGTANMDVRSFKINFETHAFIADVWATIELEKSFLTDMKDCRELTLEAYNKRRRMIKVKESISRLFSPLL